jgi:dTDP-4-amino-4,6-dideoxygalactose transaminase
MEKFIVPINVTKSFLPPIDEFKTYMDKIWENNWLTNNGEFHNEFEKELLKHLKIPYCTLFSNGHSALDIAIKALNLKGEIITTPFTFASTTHAITMNGLIPKFCDISVEDYNIDTSKIEGLINKKTCAIMPVHVFGTPCNVSELDRISQRYNLPIIYDAAHCFGVELDGQSIGNFGNISMISFHATKVFNSIEGGLLTYSEEGLKHIFNCLKNFGITGPETVEAVGMNAKMNEFQAAMGLLNLKYIDSEIIERKRVANTYRNLLSGVKGIKLLQEKENIKYNYSYFPILIDEKVLGCTRDYIYEKLRDFNVITRKYFYPLVTEYECYKGKYNTEDVPNAKYVADRILTLPIYGKLTNEEVERICLIILSIINR